jgi:hypothetical protein
MSTKRYLPEAETIAQEFPGLLAAQGLDPIVNRFVLTETDKGDAWLFAVLDDSVLDFQDSYSAEGILCRLSAALHGHPVVFSNSYGLRYAVLLNPQIKLQ